MKKYAFAEIYLAMLIAGSATAETFVRQDAIPPEFFGWVIHRAHTTTPWPTVPFGTWRLWDSYIKWSDVEPTDGVFKFDAFDKQVELGLVNKKELIYTFGQTPRWASTLPNEKHAWGMGAGAMPKDIDLWSRYVESVVARYKGRISGYEVWNEPKYPDASGNCKGAIFFCGTADDLFKLTVAASKIVKRIDPAAKLSSPGFTDGLRGVDRLDGYFATGASRYIDAVSFHLYSGKPEEAWKVIGAVRGSMAKYGISGLPIWNTETGYLVQNDEGTVEKDNSKVGPFSRVYTPKQAGGLLARGLVVQASAGIARTTWYAWDSKRMGAIRSSSGANTELAQAYAAVQYWLVRSNITCVTVSSGDSWTCKLKRNGRTATVTWRDGGGSPVTPLGDDFEAPVQYKPASTLVLDGGVVFASDDGAIW